MYNVLFFTHYLNAGGAEKVVRRLVCYINSHDYDFKARLCVIFDDPEYHDEIPDPIVLKSKSKPGDNKIIRGMNVARQIRELREVKKKYKIDLCVSFLPGSDIINVLSDTGEKRIVSVRIRESFFVHSPFRRQYVKYAYDHCDRIVAVSEIVRRDSVDFFGADPAKTMAILNAIEPKIADKPGDYVPDREDIAEFMLGHRVIVTSGRLNIQKGQDHLIRAFAHMLKSGGYDDCRLLILGDGELSADLSGLAAKLGLEERVMFAGNVHGPEKYMEPATLFVLSSYMEGIPNVILEAMQCGLPCISTECGAREILAPDTDPGVSTEGIDIARYGILIPVCEMREDYGSTEISAGEIILAESMTRMLDDDTLRTGYISKGYECISHYTPDHIYGKWMGVISDVLKNC